MKRGPEEAELEEYDSEEAAAKRQALPDLDEAFPGSSQRMGMKLLLPESEAGVLQGQDSSALNSLEGLTGTRIRLSAEGSWYPGTKLRQLTILGDGCDAVLNAVLLAINQIADLTGAVTGGEADLDPAAAHIKVVVPREVAQGLDEEGIQKLNLSRGVRVRVVHEVIPPGEIMELTEQVVCINGSLATVRGALQALGQLIAALASRSWFGRWASNSYCGLRAPGLVLMEHEARQANSGHNNWYDESHQALESDHQYGQWDEGAHQASEPALQNSSWDNGGALVPGELSVPWGGEMVLHGDESQGSVAPGTAALKLLLLPGEVAVLRGAVTSEIQQTTGTEFRFSPEGDKYPGTSLEELCIMGPMTAATVNAAGEVFSHIVAARGALGNDGPNPEPEAAHTKVVIPSKATSAVIGPGGQVVTRIRAQSQMHVHVEATIIPLKDSTDIAEQVVSFDGPLTGVQTALSMVADVLAQFAGEPWFSEWAAVSNTGNEIEGLALFQDAKGKGKAKGKSKGKDGFKGKDEFKGKDGFKGKGGPRGQDGPIRHGNPGLTLKLLLPPNEASCVLGKGGTTVREIGQVTGTKLTLSNRDRFYPGTQLQELVVKGSSQDSVLAAVMQVLERIAEPSGMVSGGESNVEPGGCRLKVVVPSQSASAIIGPSGTYVKAMRERSRLHVHVVETIIPPGGPQDGLTDQVVSFAGALAGVQIALSMLAEVVGRFVVEPWFEAWSMTSHCGYVIPGFVLFADGKGKAKGKSKGGYDMPYDSPALYTDSKGKGRDKGKFKGKPAKGDCGKSGYYGKGEMDAMMDYYAKGNSFGKGDMEPPMRDYSGKGNSFGKGDMEPPMRDYSGKGRSFGKGDVEASSAGWDGPWSRRHALALKLLMAPEEVSALSMDASAMVEIQQATGTSGMLSETLYPGTSLQELAIQGPGPDALLDAMLLIFKRVADILGTVRCGDPYVPNGDAHVKLVVPTRAAAAIIGPGGKSVKALKANAGIHVHIDATTLPCTPAVSEQGVCIAGPVASMQMALGQIVGEVAKCCKEPWFEAWASHSNAGQVVPGLVLFEGKGKGGKGGKGGKEPPSFGGFGGRPGPY